VPTADPPKPRYRAEPDPVRLLDHDPDLLDAVPAEDAAAARATTLAPVIVAERGPWRAPGAPATVPFVGLLVLEGMLARDVALGEAECTELIGPGDVMMPGEHDAAASSMPFAAALRVERSARLAVLNGSFVRSCARWPGLTAAIVERTSRRSQALAMQLAITFVTGTDVRLHALLWHLADRWGRVEPAGVVLPVPLSHERLARLVRGRRPAISQGLKALTEQGLVERRPDGSWLLRGGPPAG
jgi:CRP-like cAMP-binding protein